MKTGNSALRALLFEAAWSYRVQAKVGNWMHKRRPDIPQAIVGIAWKAQVRLSSRYRKLVGSGKKQRSHHRCCARTCPVPYGMLLADVKAKRRRLLLEQLTHHQRSGMVRAPGAEKESSAKNLAGFILILQPDRGSLPTHRHHWVANSRTRV